MPAALGWVRAQRAAAGAPRLARGRLPWAPSPVLPCVRRSLHSAPTPANLPGETLPPGLRSTHAAHLPESKESHDSQSHQQLDEQDGIDLGRECWGRGSHSARLLVEGCGTSGQAGPHPGLNQLCGPTGAGSTLFSGPLAWGPEAQEKRWGGGADRRQILGEPKVERTLPSSCWWLLCRQGWQGAWKC